MKTNLVIGVLTAAVLITASCNRVPHTGKAEMTSEMDSLSYALGYFEALNWKKRLQESPFDSINFKIVAKAFGDAELQERYFEFRKNQFDTLNLELFRKGFFNELAYEKSYFTEMTADGYLRQVFERRRAQKDSLAKIEGQANLKRGQDFLAENAGKEGITTLESGLQYEVLKQGNGPKPEATDQVKVTYHGTLLDGTVFDSSVERGDTAQFRVNGVIKGWQEALQLMPEGAKWKLYIPSDLAYGERGSAPTIGPNETLTFEVELIDVVE